MIAAIIIISSLYYWQKYQETKLYQSISSATPPEMIVENYYNWYLNNEAKGLLLSDSETYSNSEYVSDVFVKKVENILASFRDGGGYDPILCAQDTPRMIKAEKAEINKDNATVIVRSDLCCDHWFKVSLKFQNGQWKITDVKCKSDQETENTQVTVLQEKSETNIIKINDNEYYVKPTSDKTLLSDILIGVDKTHQIDPYTIFEDWGGDPAINGDWIHIKYENCNRNLHQCDTYFYDNIINIRELDTKNIKVDNGVLILAATEERYKNEIDENGTKAIDGLVSDNIELRINFDNQTKNLHIQKKLVSSVSYEY